MAAPQARIEQTDPKAYQRKLEGLVAERQPIAVLSETADALRTILRQTPAEVFRKRPFPGKWTPNEVIGHLTDAEWTMGYRTRTVLCDLRPQLSAYDQERWVATLGHADRPTAELVEMFAALRGMNLALWKKLTPVELQRSGQHAERGEESLGQMLRMLAGHDLSHLNQIGRYLTAAQA
jgi:hypothetical protein